MEAPGLSNADLVVGTGKPLIKTGSDEAGRLGAFRLSLPPLLGGLVSRPPLKGIDGGTRGGVRGGGTPPPRNGWSGGGGWAFLKAVLVRLHQRCRT